MNCRNRTNLMIGLVGTVGLLACSSETTTAPSVEGALYARASDCVGCYVLSFVDNNRQPLSSPLVVNTAELILKAHVDDGAGNPATKGSVSFQYCGYRGPRNDVTQPDEAPSADCASGLASWKPLVAMLDVDASGDAYLDFGIVLIPRTVGFRFKYLSQGSNVPNGVSDPQDFTWVAAP